MLMKEYEKGVFKHVFNDWEDEIPGKYEHMTHIVCAQFYHNKISIEYCKIFTKLIIDIHNQDDFKFRFDYHPFYIIPEDVSEFTYIYHSNVVFGCFTLYLNQPKGINVNYRENLTYNGLLEKIKRMRIG